VFLNWELSIMRDPTVSVSLSKSGLLIIAPSPPGATHRATLCLAATVPHAHALKAARQHQSKADCTVSAIRSHIVASLCKRRLITRVRAPSPHYPSAPCHPVMLHSSAGKAVEPPPYPRRRTTAFFSEAGHCPSPPSPQLCRSSCLWETGWGN
jgi:hypothetical protein